MYASKSLFIYLRRYWFFIFITAVVVDSTPSPPPKKKGISSTQAVLQSLMGMDSWMFTRLSNDIVDSMKKDKGLEFVWRASSALPAAESEIFAHVFESYV